MTGASAAPASAEVISLCRRTRVDPQATVAAICSRSRGKGFAHADHYDEDGAYPSADVAALHESGLLTAVLPMECGGAGLSGLSLSEVLRSIGSGSLPLGRLFEGHVNALELVLRYGNRDQIELVAEEAQAGKLFGVWNTDNSNGLRLIHKHGRTWLEGRKILASGAGHIERPLVTATDEDGRRMMVLPKLDAPDRADLSGWRAQGMRASATGAVDFTGVEIKPIEIVGHEGDYERQPWFSGGAWRFAAVHLGGMERLFDLLRRHLQETNRGKDPHQAARLGGATMAVETARLWVAQAASIVGSPFGIESAGAARRLRQSRAPCGGGCGSRSHAACPALGRASGFPAPEPDRAHIARPCNLSSPARPGSRADGRGGVDTRAALGRAGSVAMTAGELLDAAHSFQFRPLREQLEDRPFVVVAPHPDDESLACGGLIADACRQGLRGKVVIVSDGVGSHPNSRAYPPDRLRVSPRGRGKTSGSGAWADAGRDSLPRPPRSICPP